MKVNNCNTCRTSYEIWRLKNKDGIKSFKLKVFLPFFPLFFIPNFLFLL